MQIALRIYTVSMYVRNVNSTPVARREAEVIDAISERELVVFRPRDVQRFLDISARNTYRILDNMTEKGLVRRLARGTYVLADTYDRLDSYAIASHLEPASYVGFWSALHFHDLTAQVPRRIFVAVTTQKRPLQIQGQHVEFVRIGRASFFGYRQYGEAVVSDPEKTIIDCLRLPRHAGGIRPVASAITAELDVDTLVRYAERLDNGAVAARLGYLLDRREIEYDRDRLQALVSSYTELDPTGDRVDPVSKWKLYANVDFDA